MPEKRTRRHVKVETDLRRTTGADTAHERTNARQDTEDLTEPDQEDATPGGGAGRVADAGDVGAGQASPYGTNAPADALARQTERNGEPRDIEKPKRQ